MRLRPNEALFPIACRSASSALAGGGGAAIILREMQDFCALQENVLLMSQHPSIARDQITRARRLISEKQRALRSSIRSMPSTWEAP